MNYVKDMTPELKEALDLVKLAKMMEEMANVPKEEYGKRQPGERGKYEASRTPDA